MEKFIIENHVNSENIPTTGDNSEPSRNSKIFKLKPCKVCGRLFQPYAPCNQYCPECIPIKIQRQKEAWARNQSHRRLLAGKPVGCGRGGSNKKGKESPCYKNGIGFFHKISKQIRDEVRFCERCGKDLKDAGRYHWCVHHIDHNRQNNVRENFMLLCKRCHQLEHDCISALP